MYLSKDVCSASMQSNNTSIYKIKNMYLLFYNSKDVLESYSRTRPKVFFNIFLASRISVFICVISKPVS